LASARGVLAVEASSSGGGGVGDLLEAVAEGVGGEGEAAAESGVADGAGRAREGGEAVTGEPLGLWIAVVMREESVAASAKGVFHVELREVKSRVQAVRMRATVSVVRCMSEAPVEVGGADAVVEDVKGCFCGGVGVTEAAQCVVVVGAAGGGCEEEFEIAECVVRVVDEADCVKESVADGRR
jgi:hypothetical protein